MKVQPFTFAWEVKNFSLCSEEALVSETFATENLNDTEWMIFLFKSPPHELDFISFFLEKVDLGLNPTAVHATLQLIAADGTPGNEVTHRKNIAGNRGLAFKKFVSRRELKRLYLHNDTLKIQCIFSTDQEIKTRRLLARATCDVLKICKVWVLTKFSRVRPGILLEDTVSVQEGGEILFDVCLSFERRPGKKVLIVKFTRRCECRLGRPLSLNALITLLDAQGRESEIWKQDQHVFNLQTPEVWKFPTFISKAPLLRHRNKYLANDVLKLKCEITVLSGTLTSQIEDSWFTVERSVTRLVDKLTEHMNVLYDSNRFADVKIRVSGQTVPAHKFVLQSRSKKFAEMLDDVGGTNTGILEVPDVDIITLKRMLKFIYTDEMDDLEYDDAVLAYVAAHNYRIESLKCKYSFVLQSHLKLSNVCRIFQFADESCDLDLKNHAVDFIKQYCDRIDLSKECEGLSEKTHFLLKEVKEQLSRTFVIKHSTKYS